MRRKHWGKTPHPNKEKMYGLLRPVVIDGMKPGDYARIALSTGYTRSGVASAAFHIRQQLLRDRIRELRNVASLKPGEALSRDVLAQSLREKPLA